MDSGPLSPRRWQLCGRHNADRLAQRMCETIERGFAVVRTGCSLQPYRVLPREESRLEDVELEVILL
jgi:hypothetical protein